MYAPILIHNSLKKDYEIDWFLCFLFMMPYKNAQFDSEDFRVLGFSEFWQ